MSRGRRSVVLDPQSAGIDAAQVRRAVRHVDNPLSQPGLESLLGTRPFPVLPVEGMVALEEPLNRRWMSPAGLVHDRGHPGLGKKDPVGVAQDHARLDALLAAAV